MKKSNRVLLLALTLVACSFTQPLLALDPELIDEVTKGRFVVGACTHFGQGKGVLDLNLLSMQQAGIASFRDELSWSGVERNRGELAVSPERDRFVRQLSAAGIQPLLIFDYANRLYDDGDRPRSDEAVTGYRGYAEHLLKHFGKDVRLYEVWNEYDIPIGMPREYRKGGSSEDYFKILRAVYTRLKLVDPGAVIVGAGGPTSGGINRGWLEELVKLGALEYSDIISIHTYNHSEKGRLRSPERWAEWTADVESMLRKYNEGKDVQLFVTEMGWPVHEKTNPMTPELAASYLARLYLLARTMPYVRGLWWYDYQDDGWNPEEKEDNFGIVRPDLTPKPAWYALADVSDLVAKGRYVDRIKTADGDLWALHFEHEGRDTWSIWSADENPRQVVLRRPNGPDRTQLTLNDVGRDSVNIAWGYRPWATVRGAKLDPTRLSLVVGGRPVLLSGDLNKVTIESVASPPGTLSKSQ